MLNKKLKLFLKRKIINLGIYTQPKFMIIGVEKGGTTALFETLSKHPQIVGATKKETKFFSTSSNFPHPKYQNYYQYFPLLSRGKMMFEATPAYLFDLSASRRIREFNSDMKFIVSFRNPVYRVLSAWSMFSKFPKNHYQYENRPFDIMVKEEIFKFQNNQKESYQGYLSKGLYCNQIQEYLDNFPKKNILILENIELIENPENSLGKILKFLELPPFNIMMLESFKGEYQEIEKEYFSELEILKNFYKPYNGRLNDILQTQFEWDD